MKYVSTYEKFLEKKKYENSSDYLVENLLMILEAEEKEQNSALVPTEEKSDKEIVAELSEEDKKRIEEIVKKHTPQAKGKEIDLDNIPDPKSNGEKKVEESQLNEGFVVTAIALLPIALEAVGSLSNWFKRKFGINMTEEQIQELGKLNETIRVLKELRKHTKEDITYGVENKLTKKEYNTSNWWKALGDLSKELNDPEIAYGKGHGHGHGEHEAETKSILAKVGDEIFNKAHSSEGLNLPEPGPEIQGKNAKHYITVEVNKLKAIRDKKFGSNFGNFLKKMGHKLHSLYTLPIRAALYTLSGFGLVGPLADENTRIKVANVLYCFAMIGIAGFGIFHALGNLVGVSEVSAIILKGWETQAQLASLREESIKKLVGA